MATPLVTIAIPIYNAESYIRYAIQSCINQTYKNWELLLMCDGSTDNSSSIAKEMAATDSRIHVVDDGQNRGLIYRLNQSVRIAKGELYARMDADDIMYVTRIEEQVNFFEKQPDADVIGSSTMTIDDKNNIIGSEYQSGPVISFVHPTVMGKTIWFLNNSYSDWALRAEDFELWCRTRDKSNFYNIDKPLLFYREFGIPVFRKYCLSQKTLLKIFSRYKEYKKPFSWFLINIIVTILKIVAYALFSAFGRTDLLIKARRRNPLPLNLRLTESDLQNCIKE